MGGGVGASDEYTVCRCYLLSFCAMLLTTADMLWSSSLPESSTDSARCLGLVVLLPSAPLFTRNLSMAECISVPLAAAVELTRFASSSPTLARQNLRPSFATVAASTVDTDGTCAGHALVATALVKAASRFDSADGERPWNALRNL